MYVCLCNRWVCPRAEPFAVFQMGLDGFWIHWLPAGPRIDEAGLAIPEVMLFLRRIGRGRAVLDKPDRCSEICTRHGGLGAAIDGAKRLAATTINKKDHHARLVSRRRSTTPGIEQRVNHSGIVSEGTTALSRALSVQA